MTYFFLKLHEFFSRHRKLFFASLILIIVFLSFFASRLRFTEDITDFIPRDEKVKKFTRVFGMVSNNDKLVMMISFRDTLRNNIGELIAFADNLVAEIKTGLAPDFIRNITGSLSENLMAETYDVVWRNIPYFLEPADYEMISHITDSVNIDSLIGRGYKMLISPAGAAMKKYFTRDPFGISNIGISKLRLSQLGNNYRVYNDHLFSDDMKHLLVFISSAGQGSETSKNAVMIDRLEEIIHQNTEKSGNLFNVDYFGAAAVGVCNASRLKKDSLITMLIAVVILSLFFSWFFRSRRIVLFLLLPVVFGGVFSLALIWFIRPEISSIALGAGSIILGIAINYSIHFYSHYRHVGSSKEVIRDLANPLTIGSITTIGAFIGLMFVKSKALNDFGMVSAFCLAGSVLFTLIALPFFIKKNKQNNGEIRHNFIDKLSALRPDKNKYILGLIALITIFLMFFAGNVGFETDWNKMNYLSPELKKAENTMNLISDSSLRPVYIVSEGNDLQQALKNNEIIYSSIQHLQSDSLINQVSSVSPFLLSDSVQKVKEKQWDAFWTPERKQKLKTQLLAAAALYHFRDDAFGGFFETLDKKYTGISKKDFGYLKNEFAGDLISADSNTTYVITALKINPRNRESIMERLPENENTVIIDKQHLAENFSGIISDDFNTILIISSLLVFFFLLLSYGRIELALIAFLPMLISWIWILGIMSLLQIKFNVISIIISAFIFGLGDDYSIFIMDGLQREYGKGKKMLTSYKTAVFLSAFTTLVGVGVLIFAKHPALRSIALLTIIGMLSVVFISYTVAPAVFRWLVRNGNKTGRYPATIFSFIYALVSYFYFLFGCFLTAFFGLTLFRILPVSKDKKQLIFHYMLMYVCRTTIYIMFFTKKRFINRHKDLFKKPSVIIANHQSMIDIPLLLMFSPKVIMVTNDKWYNTKLIGIVIKLAGFMPASVGYDAIIELYREKMSKGYSLVIFPEGSRSADQKVHRFHKGAFYLADKMGLDILPIVTNGTGNYVAKGELLGKKSLITVKFLDTISHQETSWGMSYKERAHNIQEYFRAEYNALLTEYKDTRLLYDLMIKNYIYKGPVLEWYTRIKIRMENYYRDYNRLIPENARILDLGCGYGYLSMLLGITSGKRIIRGIDYDHNKIDIAEHCVSKPANISFEHADITEISLSGNDVIIMNDVLHYLPPEQQEELLKRSARELPAGGMIMLRDADSNMEKRHKGTRITEFFSTRLGFNKTAYRNLFYISSSMIQDLAVQHQLTLDIIDHTHYTSNVLFILKKPGDPKIITDNPYLT